MHQTGHYIITDDDSAESKSSVSLNLDSVSELVDWSLKRLGAMIPFQLNNTVVDIVNQDEKSSWSAWSDWSQCPRFSCSREEHYQYRQRVCVNPDGKPTEQKGMCDVARGGAFQSKRCSYDRRCLPMANHELFLEIDSEGRPGKLIGIIGCVLLSYLSINIVKYFSYFQTYTFSSHFTPTRQGGTGIIR